MKRRYALMMLFCILVFLFVAGCDNTPENTTGTAFATTTVTTTGTTAQITEPVTEPIAVTESPAADFSYEENEDGGITLLWYRGADTEVVFPSKIDGKPVTRIGGKGPFGMTNADTVKKVTLPDTITHIGTRAFVDCISLESINLPDKLIKIGTEAFMGCTSLKSITIPGGVTDWRDNTFAYSGLEAIVLEEGITTISSGAFGATKIKEIVLPSTVTTIEFQAFSSCENLEKVTLNDGLVSIGSDAFAGKSKLTEITIPKTVTDISELAFDNCVTLEKVIFEGDAPSEFIDDMLAAYDTSFTIYYHSEARGFTYPTWNGYPTEIIGAEPSDRPVFADFEYKENDENGITILLYKGNDSEVNIPAQIDGKNVTEICEHAFSSNQDITSVTIPDTVRVIGFRAFINCFSLTSVTLPEKLEIIEGEAFLGTPVSNIVFPEALKKIGDYAFSNCAELKHVRIPASVTDFGYGVFSFSGLETVEFEDGLVTIGDASFGYTNIREVVIPASVSDITEIAFAYCKNLEKVKFEGNAPSNYVVDDPDYKLSGVDYTVYCHSGAAGFTSPTWCGYKTEMW